MKILAMGRDVEGVESSEFQPHLKAEAGRVRELSQAGIILEIYFRQDRPDAVLILECSDEAEAKEILGTLPLVKENLIEFEIIPLIPYPGFSRLSSGK